MSLSVSRVLDVLSACLLITSAYIFQLVFTPPNPPAQKGETKRQIPLPRLIAFTYTYIHVSLVSLTAFRLLLPESQRSQIPFSYICGPSRSTPLPSHLSLGAFVGALIIIASGLFRLEAQRTLGRFFTWEISLMKGHKLCTTGPYAFVRHPSYLGLWGVRLGADILNSSSGTVLSECIKPRYPMSIFAEAFVLWGYIYGPVLVVWMSYRAKWEDELMEKEFGEEWKKWKEVTPYRVIPFVY